MNSTYTRIHGATINLKKKILLILGKQRSRYIATDGSGTSGPIVDLCTKIDRYDDSIKQCDLNLQKGEDKWPLHSSDTELLK